MNQTNSEKFYEHILSSINHNSNDLDYIYMSGSENDLFYSKYNIKILKKSRSLNELPSLIKELHGRPPKLEPINY